MIASEQTVEKPFEGWAILELMGHRRLAGYVREVSMFGTAMCRIDVPNLDGTIQASQFYGGQSIYCMTPTTEAIARDVAASNRPAPVQRWELPAPTHGAAPAPDEFIGEDDEDDDDESIF